MSDPQPTDHSEHPESGARRKFVANTTFVTMGGALTLSYGTFIGYAGHYLYPSQEARRGWMYVVDVARMAVGDSMTYTTPTNATVTIARQHNKGTKDDFIALSSSCPHLGCQVHWEGQNNRFFCPCHNGVFDPTGKPKSGPPADANQSLPEYPLKLENGMLFIEVELEGVT